MRELLIAAYSGFFPNGNTNPFGDIFKRLSIVAFGVTDANYNTQKVFLDLMPDTATGKAVERHGTIQGVPALGAVGAARSGALRIFGDGGVISSGERLTHPPSGLIFETRSGGTIGSSGYLHVDVAAVSTGVATNLEKDQELQFSTTPANTEQTALIIKELRDGRDVESPEAHKARILERIAEPIAGGSRSDWRQWAKEAASYVDGAYVYPNRNGAGTVDIAALKEGTGTARLLTSQERSDVLAYLEDLRPVTMAVRVAPRLRVPGSLLLLVVGTFLETLAAIVILTPVLLPITSQLGIDPVHFGIVMIVALAIGFVTPPLGANLFMAAQVGQVSFDAVVRRILPWILTMIAAVLLIAAWPGLSLFLPRLFLDYNG